MNLSETIRRCLSLIPLIRKKGGMSYVELARITGLPAQQVIAELGDVALMCGIPPYYPHNYIGLWLEGDRIHARYADHFRRPVKLTIEEALALSLALRAYSRSPEHPFAEAVAGIRKKIRGGMGSSERAALDDLERQVEIDSRAVSGVERKTASLRRAMAMNQVCRIVYYTARRHELNERAIHPYGLIEHQTHNYVVAWCEKRSRELPFRVDRIKEIEILDRSYDVPEDFDVVAYRRDEMYFPSEDEIEVKIHFDAEMARWIRESSPKGSVRPGPDGSVVRTLRTTTPRWVVDWVLPYGPHAEILHPPEVRDLLREVCEEALAAYDDANA